MAHKKAGGAKATQGGNVIGKRLGIKIHDGSVTRPGQIIVRQRGRTVIAGDNVGMGRDYTLFSLADGMVKYTTTKNNKKKVSVILQA